MRTVTRCFSRRGSDRYTHGRELRNERGPRARRRRRAGAARDVLDPFPPRRLRRHRVAGVRPRQEAIGTSTEPFAFVLTDLVMPDGSGLDVLTAAKERNPATEVIVMTAHSTVEAAIEAMRRGAYDFVTKPFATAELAALVGEGAREERDRRRERAPARAARRGSSREDPLESSARARRCSAIAELVDEGRRDAHARCSSPARAAPARSGSRARSTRGAIARAGRSSSSTAARSPRR